MFIRLSYSCATKVVNHIVVIVEAGLKYSSFSENPSNLKSIEYPLDLTVYQYMYIHVHTYIFYQYITQ